MGSQFVSGKFKHFVKSHGINHVMSDPYRQRMNGKAEAGVKQIKLLLKKSKASNSNPYMALLEYNNTPRQCNGLSPAQMMFGRPTRALLPQLPKSVHNCKHDKLIKHNAKVKVQYDKRSHDLLPLLVNQNVYFQHPTKKGWYKGTISGIVASRSYLIKCSTIGIVYRRNRVHIRPDNSNVNSSIDEFVDNSNDGFKYDDIYNNLLNNDNNTHSHTVDNDNRNLIDNNSINDYSSYLYDDCGNDVALPIVQSQVFTNGNINNGSDSNLIPSRNGNDLNEISSDSALNHSSDIAIDNGITSNNNTPVSRSTRTRRRPGWHASYTDDY